MNEPYPQPQQSNGLAIGALIVGIIALIIAIIPVVGFLSWILSPLAIILGAIALRNPVSRGAAIGGIITGIIGVLICIAWLFLLGAAVNALPEGTMQEIQAEMEKANQEADGMTPEEKGMATVEDPFGSGDNGSASGTDNSGDYAPAADGASGGK